jgi:selenobiotic family peptide radical SAM maturase
MSKPDKTTSIREERARLESITSSLPQWQTKWDRPGALSVNPTLQIEESRWRHLPDFIEGKGDPEPSETPVMVLVYREPAGDAIIREAEDRELLALKMILENITRAELMGLTGFSIGQVDAIIDHAAERGIILKPEPRIRRAEDFPRGKNIPDRRFRAEYFTLQWHLTQACDLHCRHCYDRDSRQAVTLEEGRQTVDEMVRFCEEKRVRGHVTFTGGNPLLHPDFYEFYEYTAGNGFYTAILGNPATREEIDRICEIAVPEYFQVSLEGLEEYNDYIRGEGHFQRTLEFLDMMQDTPVDTMVMLTLTRDNLDQVIPLGEILKGRTGGYNFNRLALFGEGAALALPEKKAYRDFLREYLDAEKENPLLGFKDNLLNLEKHLRGEDLFSGCTGYGCGAAFNFVSLLSDGQVHACRKLPSLIGNLNENSLLEIYDSGPAEQYRRGTSACAECDIRPLCGGCLAVSKSFGLDIFTQRDPFCFLED